MSLYQIHRPQTFGSVIGQEHIIKTLTNQIKNSRVSHAYLFSGPRGIGKTTTARLLAKAMNCENKDSESFEPCNSCHSCREISESRAIDVIEIDAASNTGVDNVRTNIIENAQFKPTKSKFKIFIIDEAHMLSVNAFNALLKIMEEPPSYIIFILATTEPGKLLQTITSRCQRFDFKKIPFEELKKHISNLANQEKIKIDSEVLDRIVSMSDGCARDAISLADQLMTSGDKQITKETASMILPYASIQYVIDLAEALITKDIKIAFKIIENNNDLTGQESLFDQLISVLRTILIIKSNGKNMIAFDFNADDLKKLQKISQDITAKEIILLLDILLERKTQIKSSPIPSMPLEMAIFEWCGEYRHNNTNNLDNSTDSDGSTNNNVEQTENSKEKDKIKTTIKEKVKKIVGISKQVELSEIEQIWPKLIEKLEQESPSLVFILKMAEIKSIKNNELALSVQYPFHIDKLKEHKCKRQIEELVSLLLNADIKIQAILKENIEKNANSEVQELASLIGGNVI
jgi:DNA polymerase-3 subunit gamma/tau